MTSPMRGREADRVELVYYWALNQLGNSVAIDSLTLWNRDVPQGGGGGTQSWLGAALTLIDGHRKEAQQLALAYYRLVGALRTGEAPAFNDESAGGTVSLEKLRRDFESIVDRIDRETANDPDFEGGDLPNDDVQPEWTPGDDNDQIELIDVADIDELIQAHDEQFNEAALKTMEFTGPTNLGKKIDALERKRSEKRRDAYEAKRKDAHYKAGSRQAANAMRIMMNAARGLVYDLSSTDLRIEGWARYSQSGDPCAFCAILISRKVLYKTRKSALIAKNDDGNRPGDPLDVESFDHYHDNCRCVAIPIFNQDQFEGSELFDQNRYYRKLYDDNIAGKFFGDEAMSKWRKLLRDIEKENENEEAAQEVA